MNATKNTGTTSRHGSATGRHGSEQPGDRPGGAPRPAALAAGVFCAVSALLLVELYGVLSDLAGFDFGRFVLVEIVAGIAVLLVVAGGVGKGKLWAVKLLRWSTYVTVLLYLFVVACSLYLVSGQAHIDSGFAWVALVFAIIQLPLLVVVYRTLFRVRWLDPKSLPSEWEPSTTKTAPRSDDSAPVKPTIRWRIFTFLLGIAVIFRYYIGLIRSNWVGEWLGSGNVLQEAAALIAIPGPFLVIGITLWLNRRARLRRSSVSE